MVRLVLGLLGLAVVVTSFAVVLPRIADYGSVWRVLRGLSWQDAGLLALATVLNIVTFAPPWMTALPGLRLGRALALTQASTAITYVAPGGAAPGIALSYGALRRWGFPRRRVALALAVIGAWNQLVILAFPAVALGLLTLEGVRHPALTTASLVGTGVVVAAVAAFAAGLQNSRRALAVGNTAAHLATRALRLFRRPGVRWNGESFVRFRHDALGLLGRRWHVLTLATLAGHLTVFGVLVASLHATGATREEIGLIEAFAAWTLIRLLGSIPITPGGVGFVELGLTGALVGFGGNEAEVVAAVLLYRSLTILPTLALGVLAMLTWRLHGRREPARAPAAPR